MNPATQGRTWKAMVLFSRDLVVCVCADDPFLLGCCEFRGHLYDGCIRGVAVCEFATVDGRVIQGDYLDSSPQVIQTHPILHAELKRQESIV